MALAIRHGGDEATAWEAAKARFVDGLPEDEQALFRDASPENLFYSSSAAFKKYDGSSKVQAVRKKIQPLLESIADYGKAMDVFANMSPMVLGALWGSLRVVIHLAQEYSKYFDKLVDMFSRIGDLLPRLQAYEMLFPTYKSLREHLSKAYLTIIEFCVDAKSVFAAAKNSKIGWATCKATWKPFAKRYDKYLSDLRSYQKNVEKEVALCHMAETEKAHEMQRQDRIAKERQRRLGLLSQLDYRRHHRRLQRIRHQGTGSWLLNLTRFQSWLQRQTSGCFCCYGIPGSGKTILASAMIDSLSPSFSDIDYAICYHYCDYADVLSLDVSVILGTLIRQILERIQISSEIAENIDDCFAEGTTKPLPEDLLDLLTKVLDPFKSVMIVLDGVDELVISDQKYILELIHRLTRPSNINMKVVIFSRREERLIRLALQKYESIDISVSLVRDDLARFIIDSVDLKLENNELNIKDPGLKQTIIETLIEGAEDMFLWVKFQLEELCETLTDDEIRNTLRDLPKDLASTYARILERYCASSGGETRIRIMQKIFPWIACARRRLTIEELNEAFAVDAADQHLHREKIPTEHKRILEACGSLILFDKEDRTVAFAHNTVKTFLVGSIHMSEAIRRLQFTLDEADFRVGQTCVTYLCFSDFETQVIRKEPTELPIQPNLAQAMALQIPFGEMLYSFRSWISARFRPQSHLAPKPFLLPVPKAKPPSGELEKNYHLLNYIVLNWTWHTTQFTPAKSPQTWSKFLALTFEKQLPFEIRPWKALDGASRSEDHHLLHFELFHWAATDKDRGAFLRTYRSIGDLDLKPYLDHVIVAGQHPLIQAVEDGYCDLIQLMHDEGRVDVRLRDAQDRTILSLASSGGHLAVVKQLLEMGARVNEQGGRYTNALQAAAEGGHLAIVEQLLQVGAEFNAIASRNRDGRTALQAAAGGGHLAVVERLLQVGAVVNAAASMSGGGRTALQAAAGGGHLAVVERLLEAKADVNAAAGEHQGRTALQAAAGGGHLAVVERLLQAGGLINAKASNYHGRTALQAAAGGGHFAMVERLLQAGANVNSEASESFGRTALQAAAGEGHLAMVERLLQAGAKVNAATARIGGKTALQAAAGGGHLVVVEWLLQAGAEVNAAAARYDGRTALQAAAGGGHLAVVERLLQAGAEVNAAASESYGRTALAAAAGEGHFAVVERLLRARANVNLEGSELFGKTALQAAAGGGHLAMVERLLQAGAEVNAAAARIGGRTALRR